MPPKPQKQVEEDMYSDMSDELDDTEYDEAEDYRPKNVLKAPRNVQYSIHTLYAMMDCREIDLDPDYQRGFVWTEPKQIALIDSVFRNYYIPPVIFHLVEEGEKEKRICIDGKQRLTSIRRFIEGLIPHKDTVTGQKYWSPKVKKGPNYTKSNERKFLSEAQYSSFMRKQIVCIEYSDLKDAQERDIFHRVQMGMPLSSAERLAAIASKNSTIVRQVEKRLDDWPANVKMANDRKRRYQLVGHVVRMIAGSPKLHSTTSNGVLEKWIRDSPEISGPDIKGLNEVFDILLDIAQNHATVAFSVSIAAQLAPVEFIYCCVLIHKKKGDLSTAQLAYAIRDMRTLIRQSFEDIRTNTKVSKGLDKIITTDIEERIKAGEYIQDFNVTSPRIVKRKREEEDDDYRGGTPMELSGDEHKITPVARRKRNQNTTRIASPNTTPPTSSRKHTTRSPVKAPPKDPQPTALLPGPTDATMVSPPSRPEPAARNSILTSLGGMFSSAPKPTPFSLVAPMNGSGTRTEPTHPAVQNTGWGVGGLANLRDSNQQ